MSKTTEEITKERGAVYGPFGEHALVTQRMKYIVMPGVAQSLRHSSKLQEDQRAAVLEGLHMILHKIGRITSGDPTYLDNWDDIAGYARITAEVLRGNLRAYEFVEEENVAE